MKGSPGSPAGARVPTPLVLAVGGGMLAVGLVAAMVPRGVESGEAPRGGVPRPRQGLVVDDSTPEAAAESFLDAWRRREHAVALGLSTGAARDAVVSRRDAELQFGQEGAELKRRAWDPLAAERLALRVEGSEVLDGQRVRLFTVAEGRFLGRPYARRIAFDVRRDGVRWRVEHMRLGEILGAPPPSIDTPLRDSEQDPSHFDPREGTSP
ncbi:MAG: hypothetical protein NZ898_15655 [Myxococcota bacterium]|nr:hypothetical protein [Myxococcota bacterium]MDW8361797.1 hypothetical protein [Myxococcales bacterium]